MGCWDTLMVNPSKLTEELTKAGIPVHGCSSEGRIDFKEEATEAQKAQALEILAKHNPYDYQEARREAYGSVESQLDMIYWDMTNGTFKWRDFITEIKERIPKI